MAFQLGYNNISCVQHTVSYDADNICLLGSFSDEISAYRTRREWMKILADYFLLEKDRDYSLDVEIDETDFRIKCNFSSACGRYAFWRLINHQAPEAERLLGTRLNTKENFNGIFSSLWKDEDISLDDSWLLDEEEDRKSWCPNFLSSAFKKINRLL